jgi:hypothetical protein
MAFMLPTVKNSRTLVIAGWFTRVLFKKSDLGKARGEVVPPRPGRGARIAGLLATGTGSSAPRSSDLLDLGCRCGVESADRRSRCCYRLNWRIFVSERSEQDYDAGPIAVTRAGLRVEGGLCLGMVCGFRLVSFDL